MPTAPAVAATRAWAATRKGLFELQRGRAGWANRRGHIQGAPGSLLLPPHRARPQLAATFRNGWLWATVEGNAELAGPDDPQPWLTDADQLRLLLREVFTAAGGTHDDWDTYDRTMAEQRRTAVLVTPSRVYSNG